MGIRTLFVATRGEIAVRIIRAARTQGIRTVQAYAPAEAGSLPVLIADASIAVAPAPGTPIDALIDAANRTGCDAVHPGAGPLADNAAFAAGVADAGMAFVGPPAEVIERMVDKVRARELVKNLGVRVVPGSEARVSLDTARAVANEVGYPVILKAAGGEGGHGIRVATSASALPRAYEEATQEVQASFGDCGLYLEKLIHPARHIEAQVLSDGRYTVHLFDRESSLQRRRRKVWEEAPSVALNRRQHEEVTAAAVRIAEAIGFAGAGTVEFLFNEKKEKFYFLEMNTRLQAEHPLTEVVTGIDLVGETLKLAGGDPLEIYQSDLRAHGHAIGVRINAEDSANRFAPSYGRIEGLRIPGGPGVRWDSAIFPGWELRPENDTLLGKLTVWGVDRDHALDRLSAALAEFAVAGVASTAPVLKKLVASQDIRTGEVNVTFLERWLEQRKIA